MVFTELKAKLQSLLSKKTDCKNNNSLKSSGNPLSVNFFSIDGVTLIIDRKYKAVTIDGIIRMECFFFEKLQIGLVYDGVKFHLF